MLIGAVGTEADASAVRPPDFLACATDFRLLKWTGSEEEADSSTRPTAEPELDCLTAREEPCYLERPLRTGCSAGERLSERAPDV